MSVDINPLLDIIADFLHFITEFFECISQSSPHIYHSALVLAPQSSIIWRLYGQQVCSPVERVVTGVPALWGSCTASIQVPSGVEEDYCFNWSPSGQSIAAFIEGKVKVLDSNTLQGISTFKAPGHLSNVFSLAFSPNGLLLACSCQL